MTQVNSPTALRRGRELVKRHGSWAEVFRHQERQAAAARGETGERTQPR